MIYLGVRWQEHWKVKKAQRVKQPTTGHIFYSMLDAFPLFFWKLMSKVGWIWKWYSGDPILVKSMPMTPDCQGLFWTLSYEAKKMDSFPSNESQKCVWTWVEKLSIPIHVSIHNRISLDFHKHPSCCPTNPNSSLFSFPWISLLVPPASGHSLLCWTQHKRDLSITTNPKKPKLSNNRERTGICKKTNLALVMP